MASARENEEARLDEQYKEACWDPSIGSREENMSTVFFGIVGFPPHPVPYGARGRRRHKGPKRSIVDFGKYGTYSVPNSWLRDTKPPPMFGGEEAARLAFEVLSLSSKGKTR